MGISTLVAVAICAAAIGGSQSSIHIKVYDPRPVAAAVTEVEKRFGRVITYEDTRYVHPSDIVDVTEKYSRSADRSKRLLVMRSSAIELTHEPRALSVDAQIEELLAEILTHHTKAGNAGEFRIQPGAGVHHVLPVAYKGLTGAMEGLTPLLDTPITFAKTEEAAYEMVLRIVAAVAAGTGMKLGPGMMPTNLFFQRRIIAEARNEPARDVLWRVLQSIRPDLSWKLLCSVGESGSCALNIYFMKPNPEPSPSR